MTDERTPTGARYRVNRQISKQVEKFLCLGNDSRPDRSGVEGGGTASLRFIGSLTVG